MNQDFDTLVTTVDQALASFKAKYLTTPAPTPTPTPTPTPNPTQGTTIKDAQGNTWSIGLDGKVYENNNLVGFTDKVILLVYANNKMYQENSSSNWWYWDGTNWVATTDPRVSPAPTPLPAPTPTATTHQFGFAARQLLNLTATQAATWLTDYKNIGIKWARVDADWRAIEPSRGTFNFASLDATVAACNTAGINVLLILTYCPNWAGSFNGLGGPPSNNADYASFCSAVVSRYAPKGVHAYEIWNEPNNSSAGYWASGSVTQMTAQYVPMLKVAYTAIKAADPSSIVITGGVCPTGDITRDPASYVQHLYAAGAKGFFNAIGVHPYTYPADPLTSGTIWASMFTGSNNIVATMQANGDSALKIWNTEFGAPTSTASNAVTEAQQASQLVNAINAWKTYTWAGNMFIYTYLTNEAVASDNESWFGIVHNASHDSITASGNKPSYGAIKTAIAA